MFLIIFLCFLLSPKFLFAQESPTATPSATLVPTQVINPSSGIFLNECLPNGDPEWIEIYNDNDFEIKLEGWKVGDNNNNKRDIPTTNINAKSFYVFDLSSTIFNNSDPDACTLINNSGTVVNSSATYQSTNSSYSWSKVGDIWCLSIPSKGSSNNLCFSPTSTPTPITPTPTLTPTSGPSNTPAPTHTPTPTKTPTLTKTPTPTGTPSSAKTPTVTIALTPTETDIPTPTEEDFPTPTYESLSLGISDIVAPTSSPSASFRLPADFLPMLLISLGSTLLLAPLAVSKLKQFKK